MNYLRLKDKKGPCPTCHLHINVKEKTCTHCHHQLTLDELAAIKDYAARQKLAGVRRALLFFPIALFLTYLVIAFIQYKGM